MKLFFVNHCRCASPCRQQLGNLFSRAVRSVLWLQWTKFWRQDIVQRPNNPKDDFLAASEKCNTDLMAIDCKKVFAAPPVRSVLRSPQGLLSNREKTRIRSQFL